jgi:hypothetical protein
MANQGPDIGRIGIPLERNIEAEQVAIKVERAVEIGHMQTDVLSGQNRP